MSIHDRTGIASYAVAALLVAMALVGWRCLHWGVSELPRATGRPCVIILQPGQAEDDLPATVCDIRRLP